MTLVFRHIGWVAFSLGLIVAVPAVAQTSDSRVIVLEEQVRQLNGQIEELNFQMLQMQESIRRLQENLEFRLQLLEDGQPQGALDIPQSQASDLAALPAGKTDRLDNVAEQIVADLPVAQSGTSVTAQPLRSLGTLTLDANGNVVASDIDFTDVSVDNGPVASVTLTGTPEDIYTEGYRHVLNGDYNLAASVFDSFVATYPDDPLVADAKFWLGESLLAQGRFEDAAEQFIDVRANHPDSPKGPETMLKIGTIMAALGNRDVACATLDEAIDRFSSMPVKTATAIESERQKARC